MKQEIKQISIRDLWAGYNVDSESGEVKAMNGNLLVNPAYQRDFIYDDKRQEAVIQTILKNCSLGLVTFFTAGDLGFTLGDGSQRIRSVFSFLNSELAITHNGTKKFYHNLEESDKEKILSYNFLVVQVDATPEEQLEWFKLINTGALVLKPQELRNACYTGPWLESAKMYFSKPNCPALIRAGKYVSGTINRQDYLETALDWISGGDIETYMAGHQGDENAKPLFDYYCSVIDWAKKTFPTWHKEMNGLNWNNLYLKYKDNSYDIALLEKDVETLLADDEVTNKKGIFEYLLSGRVEERLLSIRAFTPAQKKAAWINQDHKCKCCGKVLTEEELHGDHIIPWSRGGKTVPDNLQILCLDCNLKKSNKI